MNELAGLVVSWKTTYGHVTGHKGLQANSAFCEKVMFKYSTDWDRRNTKEADWHTDYFVGVNSRTTRCLIAKGSGIFFGATIRRHQEDKACDAVIVPDVQVDYRDYIMRGSRSIPTEVRVHTAALSHPSPTAAPAMPRMTRFRQEDFVDHGYTVGCPGCESICLQLNVGRGRTEQSRLRM